MRLLLSSIAAALLLSAAPAHGAEPEGDILVADFNAFDGPGGVIAQ